MRRDPLPSPAGIVAVTALLIGLHGLALAQHGHPLVGTWSGYWGPNAEERNRVLLLLEYDGDTIGGVINPGPNPVPITSASLEASTWTVVLEGSRVDDDGNTVEYRIEGRIENVTSPVERSLSGDWSQGGVTGDFSVTLN